MKFEIRLTSSAQQRDKLAGYAERLRNLQPGFLRMGIVGLAAAQGRIRTGGDGSWPPTYESSFGTALNRTGALLRSLTIGAEGNVDEADPHGIRVGTNLSTPSGYNIGRMMQYGTGIYGSGSPIVARGKALAFTVNGVRMFRKSVLGSPPRKFMYWDDQSAERAVEAMASYIKGESDGAGGS